MFLLESTASKTPLRLISSGPLSVRLRIETASLHRKIEQQVNLPFSITTLSQYRRCLERFYRMYRPLERALGTFKEWPTFGIILPERLQATKLARDLVAFGVSPLQLEEAPKTNTPWLPGFGCALGALYVLEGSKLGSQVIWHHIIAALGQEISGADSFFQGSGAETVNSWKLFRESLDNYGAEHPCEIPNVIEGAKVTFESIGEWMQS